jgi:undecaprenyl diphosphate synthase
MKAVPLLTDSTPPPPHTAIIMDGNGRWAEARGLPRTVGHKRGAEAVRTAVESAVELGVEYLTLYGFSSENWRRPQEEVNDLMGLLRYYLQSEIKYLQKNGVKLRVIGDRERLAPDIVDLIKNGERRTASNKRLTLIIALSYGGRMEIVMAARRLARRVEEGALASEEIDEEAFASNLFTAGIPDPDLLIRTSGEKRISNFLLWQLAYAEFVFVNTLWPDFSKQDFENAIREYHGRERRYGTAGT